MYTLTSILGYLAAICTTISFLPQAIKIIKTKNTRGISLVMYTLFTVGTLLWLLFGIFTNNIPIIIANAITLLFACTILFYTIKF